MTRATIKTIVYYAATISIFVAGLVYMLMSDLTFGNSSQWLILSVIFSFGSGICAFVSAKLKDKIVPYYILKGSAIALAIAYIVFLILFTNTTAYTSVAAARVAGRNATMVISYILGGISTALLVADTALDVFLPEE